MPFHDRSQHIFSTVPAYVLPKVLALKSLQTLNNYFASLLFLFIHKTFRRFYIGTNDIIKDENGEYLVERRIRGFEKKKE